MTRVSSSNEAVVDAAGDGESPSLLTREQGAALREQVLALIGNGAVVTINMAGLRALSPSSADELFGGLSDRLGPDFEAHVRVRCPSAEWRTLIRSTLAHRRRRAAREGRIP